MSAGIYRIVVDRGDKPKKFYIGQAADLRQRRHCHFSQLRRGKHRNTPLQHAFLTYGEGAFSFETLIICARDKNVLSMYEQLVLDSYEPESIYNIWRSCSTSRLGVPMPQDTRVKMRSARLGKKCSAEMKAKMRAIRLGTKMSVEACAKMAVSFTGRSHSAETKEKMRLAHLGRKMSDEAREKLSRAKTGTKLSEDTKGKLRAANLGKKASEETKRKISAANVARHAARASAIASPIA